MNLDRFGFKAKSNQRGNYWLYASLDFYEGVGSYGVRYHLEPGGVAAFSPAWIDPKTICQCTGIKDSDGNLIYENDIIQTTDEEGKTAEFEVKYNERDMSYEADGKTALFPFPFLKYYVENDFKWVVIGNKFDKESDGKETI